MVKELMPSESEMERRHVAAPEDLEKHYPTFEPSGEDIEETDLHSDIAEEQASLHREIKEIEDGVSDKNRLRINQEIHREHRARLHEDLTIGTDFDHLDDVEAEQKRKIELVREKELEAELNELLKDKKTDKSTKGFLSEWDELTEKEKKPFLEALTVRKLINFLSGRAVVQQKIKEEEDKNKK